MTTKGPLECIKQNADLAEKIIAELKSEINLLTTKYNNIRSQQLFEENKILNSAVDAAKKKLIQLEVQNGIKQIPIPNQEENIQNNIVKTQCSENEIKSKETSKVKSEKKAKEPGTKQKPVPESSADVDIGRLDLRIAKIEDVQKHPDADSLYVLKINCGENKPRTVCSGLVKFVALDDLKDRDVLLLCNLKPVKMRGITSEAMVMCASSSDGVEVLVPPANCQPGEVVDCDGYSRNPDPILNPKKKIFEAVAVDLSTNDLKQACYKATPIVVPGKGNISSATLKNCPIK